MEVALKLTEHHLIRAVDPVKLNIEESNTFIFNPSRYSNNARREICEKTGYQIVSVRSGEKKPFS